MISEMSRLFINQIGLFFMKGEIILIEQKISDIGLKALQEFSCLGTMKFQEKIKHSFDKSFEI